MKIKLVKLLLMSCSVIAAACAARRVRDYSFDVTGYVAAEDGSPLQEVEVTLHVDTPVYEALTPVKNQRLVTSKGVFMFRYLSHDPATKYTVTVSKEGFQPQTVSGNALTPSRSHSSALL